MADLGPTTIFGDLTTNGSLGGAVRIAYCGEDAPADTEISCFLDTDTTGEVVTVKCLTGTNGASLLNASVPRLSDGDPMFVIKHNSIWYSTTIFEDSEDFDAGLGLPKLKYVTGYTVYDDSASPYSVSGANWGVSKSIIKAIKVTTTSLEWDLILWTNSSTADYGIYDNGYVTLASSASGSQVILLDLPYIDYDNSSSIHLQFFNKFNNVSATVDIYGVEART